MSYDTYLIQVLLHRYSLAPKKLVPPVQLKYLYKTNGGKEAKLTHTFNSLWQQDIKNHSGGNKVRSVTIQL